MNIFKDKFICFLILAHSVFLIFQLMFGNYLTMLDSQEYYLMAENIIDKGEFYCGDLSKRIDIGLYTRRPPLYPLFIIISSLFTKSKVLVILFQNILSIFSIIMIRNIFVDFFRKINPQILFAFTCTSVSHFIYPNMLMSEAFLQFLISTLIYSTHLFLKYKLYKHLFFYQGITILLLLTKPVFYLFIVPNIIITYFICSKAQLKIGVFSSILPIIVVLGYCQWNFERTGSYDFSSIQHVNLRDYNLKYFHLNKYGEEYAKKINLSIRNETDNIQNYPDKINTIKSKSIKYLQNEIISYAFFHLKGTLKFFIDPGRYDLFIFFYPDSKAINQIGFLSHYNKNGILGVFNFLKTQPTPLIILLFSILFFNILKFLGFLWFWVKNFRGVPLIFWIMLLIIGYISIITGPIGAARFLIPILPLYLFFSIYGITDLIKKTKSYCTRTSLTSPSS